MKNGEMHNAGRDFLVKINKEGGELPGIPKHKEDPSFRWRLPGGIARNEGSVIKNCSETRKLLQQQLCDLDGIGRRALAYLVAAAPEVQAALVGQILTDTADKNRILVGRVERHGVDPVS